MWAKSMTIFVLAFVAIIIVKAAELPGNELNGKWVIKSVQNPDGRDPDRGKGIEVTISNEVVMAKKPGRKYWLPAFLIKPQQGTKPPAVDIWETDFFLSKTREEVLTEPPVLAIYELKGSILRLCFSPLETRSRPAGFETTNSTLVTLEQQKP